MGTGYSYRLPKGWGQPQDIPGFDPDSLAADLQDTDGFADNVNVILSPAGRLTLEQAEDGAENELASAGAKNIAVEDRVQVGGIESAHVTAVMSLNDNGYTIEQFYTVEHDQTFVVTFSFSANVSARDRTKVTGPVLSSWTWTD